jgi:hypothetical protein
MFRRISIVYHTLVKIVPLTTVLILGGPFSASAVCPEHHPAACAEFFHSSAVFSGTVISANKQAKVSDVLDAGWVYRLKVKKLYRGSSRSVIQVFTEDASERFPLETGHTYLLFAHAFPGGLEIDSCGNSIALAQARTSIDRIGKVLAEQKSATGGHVCGRVVESSDTETGVKGVSIRARDGLTIHTTVTNKEG